MHRLALLTLAGSILVSPLSASAVTYTLHDMGSLGGRLGTMINSVNASARAVGSSRDPGEADHAVVYDRGTLIDIGMPPGTIGATASKINDAGRILGNAWEPWVAVGHLPFHTFFYDNGVMTDLGRPPGFESIGGADFNDNGEVAGNGQDALGQNHALRYSGGVWTDIGDLGSAWAVAISINNAGQIAGRAVVATEWHAFLYSGGTMTDLGTLGGESSEATKINNAGQVIGTVSGSIAQVSYRHAFLYGGGVMTDLGTFGGDESHPWDMNDAGQVVGDAYTATGALHAFLYSAGVMTDLGTLGGTHSFALAINASGQVVGAAETASGEQHAFLYSGGVMTDLGTLGSWMTCEADDISDTGYVVGRCNDRDAGTYHSFITSICGNGIVDPGEPCDGGPSGSANCCTANCTLIDGDGDGVCDALDNCPSIPNPDQRNSDNQDGGDLCDPCPFDPAATCTAVEQAKSGAGLIGSAGGTVTTADGSLSITIPPGALPDRCNDAPTYSPCTTNDDCYVHGATVCGGTSVAINGGLAQSTFGIGGSASNLAETVLVGPRGTTFVKRCAGGANANALCTAASQCPDGTCRQQLATMQLQWPDVVAPFGTVDNTSIVETNLKIYHNGSQIGVCSLDPSLTCTAPTVTADCGGGSCVRNDCGTQGTTNPASSCDPTDPTNTWTFKTGSFSEFALGLDCPDTLGGVTLLRLAKLLAPAGNEKATFKGQLQMLTSAVTSIFDPLTYGSEVMLLDDEVPLLTAVLPPGAYDAVSRVGWKRSGSGTKWTYLNKSATPPGNVTKAVFKTYVGDLTTYVTFVVTAKNATLATPAVPRARIVMPGDGECFEARYPGGGLGMPTCTLNRSASALKCK